MATLITIPGATAFHLPAPGATPVPLAHGDLTLNLLPAQPPTRKTDSLIFTVGTTSFAIAQNSPVQRTRSKNEHPSFIFTPAPPSEGQSIGQVRLDVKDSKSPEEWEQTENACTALQAELRSHGVWEDKVLFVDDEYETGGPVTGPKVGWGEWVAGGVLGFGNRVASSLGMHKDQGLPTTNPTPGAYAPTAATGTPTDFRSFAADTFSQAGVAARGIGQAALTVGTAVGHQARQAVEELRTPTQQAPAVNVAPTAEQLANAPAVPAKDPSPAPAPARAPVAAPAPAPVDKADKPAASNFSVGDDVSVKDAEGAKEPAKEPVAA